MWRNLSQFVAIVCIVCVAGSLQGCGFIFQSIAGWSDEQPRTRQVDHTLSIVATPGNATIARVDAPGKETEIGVGVVEETVGYEVKEVVSKPPNVLPLILGSLIDLGLVVAGAVGIAAATEDAAVETARPMALAYYFAFVGMLPLGEWIAAGVFAFGNDNVKSKTSVPVRRSYVARATGYPDVVSVAEIPTVSKLELNLANGVGRAVPQMPPPLAVPQPQPQPPAVSSPSSQGAAEGRVVAVMEVEDSNAGDSARAINRSLLRNIGDQLRIFVATHGFRTVDRGAMESALREQIDAVKRDSYKTCYDESCQIELGKALAASFILRSRVTRFGSQCVLNGELVDLRSEVTVGAASSRGNCEPEGFINMSEEVAKKLASGR